jgi:predicted phage terminase large subunit-like protein
MVSQTEAQLQEQLITEHLKKLNSAEKGFIPFVRHVWPDFISGYHHKKIAKKFEDIRDGKIKRLIVNMPPRHTKSEFASFLFPSWLVGNNPQLKIIQTTHNTELAVRFGRKMKNLIDSQVYQQVFDEVAISADSKAAGRWETNKGGEYFAAGVGSSITGRGADLLIIDDPHSEQDALSETAFDNAYEWYTSGPRQRLQPGGAIVIVMTSWSVKDLTGRLIDAQAKEPKADQWELIEFPAILPSEKPIWPEYWDIDSLTATRASLTEQKWQAQWQQNPTAEEGSIFKREWWQTWDEDEVPDLIHVIQSYDTAFSKKETADFSAITTWGVFSHPRKGSPQIILLDAEKGRWEFTELKKIAMDKYKYWEPETVIVEAKASGLPLTDELRSAGIPVVNFTPSRGNDKHVRVNSVAPMFESGQVWCPDERWAQDVIEECAAFPFGDHDDYVDSTTQALMRYRQGNFVQLPDDYYDEPRITEPREYY